MDPCSLCDQLRYTNMFDSLVSSGAAEARNGYHGPLCWRNELDLILHTRLKYVLSSFLRLELPVSVFHSCQTG